MINIPSNHHLFDGRYLTYYKSKPQYQPNQTGTNNNGNDYIILGRDILAKDSLKNRYIIKYTDTGYCTSVLVSMLKAGKTKDKYTASVVGVGIVGDAVTSRNGVETKIYKLWRNIITRCYTDKYHITNPWYKDCYMHSRWLYFPNFEHDLPYIEGYQDWLNGEPLEFDKDTRVPLNRMYSALTCRFITPQENAAASSAKTYVLTDPDGTQVSIFNMSEYCREHALSASSMRKVAYNKQASHKGYTPLQH